VKNFLSLLARARTRLPLAFGHWLRQQKRTQMIAQRLLEKS
jgi:hypothetical protein